MMRIMIFDGAPETSQRRIRAEGGPSNGELFARAMEHHERDVESVVVNVADGERLPQGLAIGDFDGVLITGSPLNVYVNEPAVTRQITLARVIFDAGVPIYGSCWGMQLMTVALGGRVHLNPKGREVGIARNIVRTEAGRSHMLFDGKAQAFDALCSHQDEVASLPDGAVVLASNGVSDVQAMEVVGEGKSFVGVQYHPEHAFATTAAILSVRRETLAAEGLVAAPEALEPLIRDLRQLDQDPTRRDVAWRLGIDAHVTDAKLRTAEIGNWLRNKVQPRRALRAAAAVK